MSNENLRQAICTVTEETEEEELNIILDANNVTMDNFCQYPVTNNTQGENANTIFKSERQNTSYMLAEMLKGLTLDSTINDSAYYNLDEDDAESDPKSNPLVATHTREGKKRQVTDTDTTNGNYPQKLLFNRTLPMITPPIEPRIADGVAAGIGTTQEPYKISPKVIVTDAARSGAHVFRNPADVSHMETDRKIPKDGNTSIRYPMLTYLVMIGGGTTVYPTRTGRQNIISPKGPTGSVEVKNAQPLHTFINGNSAKNGYPKATLSKVISQELSDDPSANIYLRCWANFTRDTVVTEIPNFMNLGLSTVHTLDELGSFIFPSTSIGMPTDGSN